MTPKAKVPTLVYLVSTYRTGKNLFSNIGLFVLQGLLSLVILVNFLVKGLSPTMRTFFTDVPRYYWIMSSKVTNRGLVTRGKIDYSIETTSENINKYVIYRIKFCLIKT